MGNDKSKKDLIKKWTYGIIILVVIGIGATYSVKKKQFLNKGLPQLVEHKSKELYNVSYESIDVDELRGNVSIKNLHVVGDTAQQQALIQASDDKASKALFNVNIPLVQLTGFKTAKALISKKIICDKIIINDPEGIIEMYDINSKKNIKQQSQEFYKQLLGKFELIQTDLVEINNAKIVARDYLTKQKKFEAFNTSILLNDVRIDSLANLDTSRTFFCKDLMVRTENLAINNKGKATQVVDVSYNTKGDKLAIGDIKYEASKGGNKIYTDLQGLKISELQLHGPLEGLFISANSLNIESVLLISKEAGEKDNGKSKSNLLLPPWLKKLSVNVFQVKNVSYKQPASKAGEKDFVIDQTSVTVNKIRLDSNTNYEQSLTRMFGALTISNPGIAFYSKDGLYKYAFSNIVCNTKERSIKLKEIAVIPALTEKDFAKKVGFRRDRYDVKFKDVVCRSVDFDKFFKGDISIETIATSNSFFKVFLDLSYPVKKESKLGKDPNQILFSMKQSVRINKFIFKNGYIEYKEKNAKTDSSGKVRFVNSNITITNITNRPKNNEVSQWNFTSNFLGAVMIKGEMKFHLNEHTKGAFDITGSMGSVDAEVFNQLAIPMMLARFDKGHINSANFKLSGDNYTTNGTVNVDYDHLKLSFLKLKGDELHKNNISSIVANLMVKNSNSRKSRKQQAAVNYTKDTNKSFFFNLWKTIHKGINEILIIVK